MTGLTCPRCDRPTVVTTVEDGWETRECGACGNFEQERTEDGTVLSDVTEEELEAIVGQEFDAWAREGANVITVSGRFPTEDDVFSTESALEREYPKGAVRRDYIEDQRGDPDYGDWLGVWEVYKDARWIGV
jgi:Zn ribbon nucleic-acid-binding protein